ncbi:MAG TPA: amidase [Vicinamibacterales bacterium]|nr:amidase [Vicinamibacterales bacterium]
MTTTKIASLREAAIRVADRTVSPVDLTKACLARIDARNPELRAFISVMADEALAEAARAEKEIGRGRYRGALHGIPVSVKDLVDVAGTPTTSGSNVPARRAQHDAPVVGNLRRAGAVIIGKTNLHEFAFGTTSDETAFGAVRNPYDLSRSPGGSSGGAAVAIVEGMCYGAVGTDTGGSIRIPSAACGITGLKPTFGEISTDGVVPLSTTLDHVGPLAANVGDAALLFHAMFDAGARLEEAPAPADAALWLGVPVPYFLEKLDSDVRRLFSDVRASLERVGHTISDVAIAHAERTADAYLHIVLPEASWYHAPMLRDHADKYSPGVRLRLEMGRYVLAEDYLRALQARSVLRRAVDRALEGLDALLLPAMPIGAPPIGASTVSVGDATEPVRAIMLRLTQLFNMTGHPAIVMPCGRGADGLPRALQLVGHRGSTDRLLEVALAVERQITGGDGSVGGGTG